MFSLCKRLQTRLGQRYDSVGEGLPTVEDLLQPICTFAGGMDSFTFSENPLSEPMLPKQQTLAAVELFIQHLDHSTDIFCHDHLRSRVRDIYTGNSVSRDETWAICIKTIVLLVVDREFTRRLSKDGLFSRPSRNGIIPSRLLATPSLVAIQTLLLMSVAVQHFDPFGWAEFLFSHACVLARTMGLHHTPLAALTTDKSSSESIERAKVLRALYCRDQSLAAHRGCVPSLFTGDRDLAADMNAAASDGAPYAKQIQLAATQDMISRTSQNPAIQPSQMSQFVELQLEELSRTNGSPKSPSQKSPPTAMDLELQGLRMLASRQCFSLSCTTQLLSNARASCCVLLIALGQSDARHCEQLDGLMSWTPGTAFSRYAADGPQIPESSRIAALDAFPVASYFVLYEAQTQGPASASYATSDFDLLWHLTTCYAKCAAELQRNSYHGKVAEIFEQLMHLLDGLKSVAPSAPGVHSSHPTQHSSAASGSSDSLNSLDMDWMDAGTDMSSGQYTDWNVWNDWLPAQGADYSSLSTLNALGDGMLPYVEPIVDK